ncbi:single-stranded DNA-binding protein [uncultured Microbacterium sp.]|uniref:single-stranded DNA-binding protein n=1 Tax=uncultured Microbacterium sp. TaxID=191216 RepID=UPI0028D08D7C|nr:single-stranded DNA-binding protein [uncultured Microbacterium sp.]
MNDTITIVGTVGTDPEKKVRNGVPITTFRVASKERRFDRATGSWVDGESNWYTVSAYRRLAEHVFESVHRRERVVLTGRLKIRNWDTGEKRGTSVDIDIDAIGHDLLFGTTTFRADESGPAATASAPEGWASTGADDGGWESAGAQGSSSLVGGDAAAVSAPEDDSDTSSAGAQRPLSLAGAETPF